MEQRLDATLFHTWQRLFFENGATAIERPAKERRTEDPNDRDFARGAKSVAGVAKLVAHFADRRAGITGASRLTTGKRLSR